MQREQQLLERVAAGALAPRPPSARRASPLKQQIARLERELSAIARGAFPVPRARPRAPRLSHPRRRTRGPRLPDLGELERERDHLAGARAGAAPRGRSAQRTRATRARAAGAHAPGTRALPASRALPVRDLGQRGLRGLERAAAPRPDRHARRLVAAHAVVGLSVSQGVALQARPRSPSASIAARQWRWRSVIEPIVLFSDSGTIARNLRQRVLTPAALAHQQVGDGHAASLPGALENHARRRRSRRPRRGA